MSEKRQPPPARDPLVVTVPNPLAKVAHDQGLIGRNAVALTTTVSKHGVDGQSLAKRTPSR